MQSRIGAATFLLVLATTAVFGQANNPLVGAWERISQTDAQGKPVENPAPPAFVMFSASGYFSGVTVPSGRPKITKPVREMTKEELLARFDRVVARRGTYRIEGNKLLRHDVTNINPNIEGTDAVQLFRVEGDILVIGNADPKSKAEDTFRRVK
jgi:Lipocalin-like domain